MTAMTVMLSKSKKPCCALYFRRGITVTGCVPSQPSQLSLRHRLFRSHAVSPVVALCAIFRVRTGKKADRKEKEDCAEYDGDLGVCAFSPIGGLSAATAGGSILEQEKGLESLRRSRPSHNRRQRRRCRRFWAFRRNAEIGVINQRIVRFRGHSGRIRRKQALFSGVAPDPALPKHLQNKIIRDQEEMRN